MFRLPRPMSRDEILIYGSYLSSGLHPEVEAAFKRREEKAKADEKWRASPHRQFRDLLTREVEPFATDRWALYNNRLFCELAHEVFLNQKPDDDHHWLNLKKIFIYPEDRGKKLLGRFLSSVTDWATRAGCSIFVASSPFEIKPATEAEDKRRHFRDEIDWSVPKDYEERQRRMNENVQVTGFIPIKFPRVIFRNQDQLNCYAYVPKTADRDFKERFLSTYAKK